MKCPNCETTLVMTDRQGVEIDHCPECRGVWLDRGELDKIIERSARFESDSPGRGEDRRDDRRDGDRSDERREGYYRDGDRHPHYHKRKSFWSELFD